MRAVGGGEPRRGGHGGQDALAERPAGAPVDPDLLAFLETLTRARGVGDQRPYPQDRQVHPGRVTPRVDAAVVDVEPLPGPLQQRRRRRRRPGWPGQPRQASVTPVEHAGCRLVQYRVTGEQQQRPVLPRHLGVGGDRELLGQAELGLQLARQHRQDLVVGVLVQAATGLQVAKPEPEGRVGDRHGSVGATSWSVRPRLAR
jgi:hypothetical protein